MTNIIDHPKARVAAYIRMAGLTGADLEEHKRMFPDFADWLRNRGTPNGSANLARPVSNSIVISVRGVLCRCASQAL